MGKDKRADIFLDKAINLWGDKYDYSKVEYVNYKTPVCIGYKGKWYMQTPNKHLQGRKIENTLFKMTTKEFIEKSKQIWGDRFDYSRCEYNGINHMVKLYDNVNERWIEQIAKSNLNGNEVTKLTKDIFIERCNIIHSYKYNYDNIDNYKSLNDRIDIICPLHGDFNLKASSHVFGSMCPHCVENDIYLEIQSFFNKRNISCYKHYTFDDCRYRGNKIPFTFFIPSMRSVVIYTGVQFYESVNQFGGISSYDKLNEILKCQNKFCEENFLNNIIIKPSMLDNIHRYLYDNIKIFL